MFGDIVSRRSARVARPSEGSHSSAIAASLSASSRALDPVQQPGRRGGQPFRRDREEPLHHRGQAGRLEGGEAADDLGGEDRGIVVARHRAVAPGPSNRDPVSDQALLGNLDRVEPAAGELDRDAAAFIQRTGGAEPLGPVRGDPARALHTAGLFVGGRGEEQVPGQAGDRVDGRVTARGTRLVREHPDHRELEGHHALHVDGTATPHVAVVHVATERIVGPELRRRGDDVEVREQEQRRTARPVAAQPAGHGAPAGERFHDLRPQAGVGQDRLDVASGEDLVAGRIDALDPDERLEQLNQLGVGPLPTPRVDGA